MTTATTEKDKAETKPAPKEIVGRNANVVNVYGFTVYRKSAIDAGNQLGEGVMVVGMDADSARVTLMQYLDPDDVVNIQGGNTVLAGAYLSSPAAQAAIDANSKADSEKKAKASPDKTSPKKSHE